MKISKILPAAALALWLVAPSGAQASAIAFDTFGPGDSSSSLAYGVDGDLELQAFHFVAAVTGNLESITVAIGHSSSAARQTRFILYDGTGSGIGVTLESTIVVSTAVPGPEVVTFASLLQPLLTAGQDYWLAFTEPDAMDGNSSRWYFNNQGIFGTRLTNGAAGGGQATLPAFRVTVSSVAEPATLALFGLGLAGLAGMAVRRRQTA